MRARFGRQRRLAARDAFEQAEQLVRGQVLEEVPLRPTLDGLEEVGIVLRGGQDDDFDVWMFGADQTRGV